MDRGRGLKSVVMALIAASLMALSMTAQAVLASDAGLIVENAYLRSSTPNSKSAAAFLMLRNLSDTDDRLIGARADLGGMVQLHSHSEDANGVMRMGEIEGGVPVAAGGMHVFERGGDHLMFMGLTAPLVQGQDVPVTLIFENAGEVEIVIPVDHERKASHGHKDQ